MLDNLAHDGHESPQVRPRSQLRHDAAIPAAQVELRRHKWMFVSFTTSCRKVALPKSPSRTTRYTSVKPAVFISYLLVGHSFCPAVAPRARRGSAPEAVSAFGSMKISF